MEHSQINVNGCSLRIEADNRAQAEAVLKLKS